jgi:hypothetical protein
MQRRTERRLRRISIAHSITDASGVVATEIFTQKRTAGPNRLPVENGLGRV